MSGSSYKGTITVETVEIAVKGECQEGRLDVESRNAKIKVRVEVCAYKYKSINTMSEIHDTNIRWKKV